MTRKIRGRLQPLSLHPLTPEKALAAFMKVDPKKVERRFERERGLTARGKA